VTNKHRAQTVRFSGFACLRSSRATRVKRLLRRQLNRELSEVGLSKAVARGGAHSRVLVHDLKGVGATDAGDRRRACRIPAMHPPIEGLGSRTPIQPPSV
jgi:hypothetical protein